MQISRPNSLLFSSKYSRHLYVSRIWLEVNQRPKLPLTITTLMAQISLVNQRLEIDCKLRRHLRITVFSRMSQHKPSLLQDLDQT
jgi:hypothetical protein